MTAFRIIFLIYKLSDISVILRIHVYSTSCYCIIRLMNKLINSYSYLSAKNILNG